MFFLTRRFKFTGTWQTYIVKEQDVWHKINKDSPMEYAATISVNPLTALRMLEDFTNLNSGRVICICNINKLKPSLLFLLIVLSISRRFYCAKWSYKYCGAMHNPACTIPWNPQYQYYKGQVVMTFCILANV